MSNDKSTPGPWKIKKFASSETYDIKTVEPGKDIATVWDLSSGFSAAANARLIASAPELLEELKRTSRILAKWRDGELEGGMLEDHKYIIDSLIEEIEPGWDTPAIAEAEKGE